MDVAFESDFCCSVFGGDSGYVLIDLSGPLDAMYDAKDRGWTHVGTLGIIGGEYRASVASGLDVAAMRTLLRASAKFAVLAWERLRPQLKGDEVAFLESLFALEDKRT